MYLSLLSLFFFFWCVLCPHDVETSGRLRAKSLTITMLPLCNFLSLPVSCDHCKKKKKKVGPIAYQLDILQNLRCHPIFNDTAFRRYEHKLFRESAYHLHSRLLT